MMAYLPATDQPSNQPHHSQQQPVPTTTPLHLLL
jgi:hypothetical protein